MPARDTRDSDRDRGFEDDDDIDITFEEYIGPGFVSRGWYDEVVWPPPEVCEACGRPLAPPAVETIEVRADEQDRRQAHEHRGVGRGRAA